MIWPFGRPRHETTTATATDERLDELDARFDAAQRAVDTNTSRVHSARSRAEAAAARRAKAIAQNHFDQLFMEEWRRDLRGGTP